MFEACGLKQFYLHKNGGWSSSGADFQLRGMKDVRYNLAAWQKEVMPPYRMPGK
jgi:hypothetical protein